MPAAGVYNNGILAGVVEKKAPDDYVFEYDEAYYTDQRLPAISLSLPKTQRSYQSPVLFSFFTGLLAEGINKDIQCRLLKIDEDDDFTRLLKTAAEDTIGAIAIKEITEAL